MTDTVSTSTGTESAVERSFRVLQTVVAAEGSLGVREIGRRTGLPRSTVSRLVAMLSDIGMLARTQGGGVRPGSALATLQPEGSDAARIEDQLRPLLGELVSTFGENAALSVDDGDRLLYIAEAKVDHAVSVPDVTSIRHDFHTVAPGLATMATFNDQRLDEYLDIGLQPATPHTITDANKVRARLELIRRAGHVWTNQELDVGVNGIAIALFEGADLAATISVFGPDYRFSESLRPEMADDMKTIVDRSVHHLPVSR